jgi:crotonobetainyl-CoA:carnitine CoA-transferase CaiB-like acyl-CoA transferase
VLDFSTHWASPHATRILADSGAEVITVEFPGLLCLFRGARLTQRKYDDQPSWHAINRNKKSITLDLRRDADRAIARDLVASCDVVVENSRTGVMDRFGLGFEALQSIRPDIILLSLTGYGGTGPWADYCAMGAAIESTSGIQSLTGYRDGDKRYRVKELDICTGVMGACAVMTALFARSQTGKGRHLDLSMMESATHAQIGEHLLYTDVMGAPPPVLGNRDTEFAPQGAYPCRGEDAWVVITVRNQAEWHALCDFIGKPEWKTDPDLQDADGRRARHDLLDAAIGDATRPRDHYEVMTALQEQGVPAGAVLSLTELAADPHVRERGVLVRCEQGGDEFCTHPPIRMSDAALRIRHRGPDLGAHNREVIQEMLGRPLQDVPHVDETQLFSAYFPLLGDRPTDAETRGETRDGTQPP